MNYYNIRMDREGNTEEVWTHLEAMSKPEARLIVERKWGEGWRAVEIKPGQRFIHCRGDDDPEHTEAVMLEKIAKLKAKNSRAVVTPLGEFASIKEAGKAYGTREKLLTLIRKFPAEYYFK